MYHVLVIGLEPAGWLKAVSLLSSIRALKTAGKALPGFKGAKLFKSGHIQYTALVWTSAESLEHFEWSNDMANVEMAAQSGARCYAAHSFVCQKPPSKEEIALLWHSARHAAVA
ncbi:hypothetical protein [Primorskyibacter sp. 2E233]|uniref:hypothetical protein n=1 Tax=Primorskyibacter sp. 2E233 TaxID=3413431 RepID=UPI003BEF7F6D